MQLVHACCLQPRVSHSKRWVQVTTNATGSSEMETKEISVPETSHSEVPVESAIRLQQDDRRPRAVR